MLERVELVEGATVTGMPVYIYVCISPDYWKHCLSLNFPFSPNNDSSSTLVPEQQQARVWVWAAGGLVALCGGTEVGGWVFRLGSSDVHGAVALLSIQSDSHCPFFASFHPHLHLLQTGSWGPLQVPICTSVKQRKSWKGKTAGEIGALSFLNPQQGRTLAHSQEAAHSCSERQGHT